MSDIETGNKRAAMHDRRVVASTASLHLVGGGVGARWQSSNSLGQATGTTGGKTES